jgi:hypothetical protein
MKVPCHPRARGVALQVHQQDLHRGRGDAGQGRPRRGWPAGPPELWRTEKSRHALVVQPLRQREFLVAARALNFGMLALDVAGVLGAHLDLRAYLGRQPLVQRPGRGPRRLAGQGAQRLEADLRAAQQFKGRGIPRQRCAQDRRAPGGGHVAGPEPQLRQAGDLRVGTVLLGLEQLPAFRVDQSQALRRGCQAQVGVVLAQQQPVLGAAGEHAVGLGGAAADQVIDQDPQVGLAPQRRPRRLAAPATHGVDAGEQSRAAASS